MPVIGFLAQKGPPSVPIGVQRAVRRSENHRQAFYTTLRANILAAHERRTEMKTSKLFITAMALTSLSLAAAVNAQQPPAPPQLPQAPNMTFFVTGAGPGKGADLGGLEGADRHCQELAQRHGAGGKTWHA